MNTGAGEVCGDCRSTRDGIEFPGFLRKAVKPHAGMEVHVVLDNLSTYTTPEVRAWPDENPYVAFHFTPTGSSWLNMVENWFGIRRGTFTKEIRDYIAHWNTTAQPFEWTATADEILAKGRTHPGQRQEVLWHYHGCRRASVNE